MDHQASITKSDLERMLFDKTSKPKPLPFSLLERITNGFSYKMEVGRGGFAVVYKAMLEKGDVAVKRLTHPYMQEKEFFQEVECLMKVNHRNIVRFLGYCVDTQGDMIMHQGKYVMTEIQQRLLCFEYLPNGGLDRYIKDPSCGLEWIDRYDIIKGICEGLDHLHQLDIVHLDLKPANILLDENMKPKITDFGISRNLQEDQTHITATKVPGTAGYMAPEFLSHRISKKYDLYSLGIIILEIMTGERRCQGVETVLKSWSDRLTLSHKIQECEQIRVCVEIGIECTDFDPEKRPVNVKHIIERLSETRLCETESIEYYNELHPLKHRFYPRLSESIPCSLQLTNKTDEHVAFRLVEIWSMYGVVPPRSTCTWIGPTKETGIDLVLQSSISGNKNITLFETTQECSNFFKQAEELGHAVYEVAINTRRRGETTSELAVRPTIIIKPVFKEYGEILSALDAHPTKPWIVMGFSDGNVSVWDHESKTTKNSFKISWHQVISIQFHAKKNWIVAATPDKFIHVYDCACITQIKKIKRLGAPTYFYGYSPGIHPTKPYVVSSSMELWDGDKGWQCTAKFGTRSMRQLKFNQEDPNSFAVASNGDHVHVEVWSLDSPEPNYTLYGHSGVVNCLEFFKHGDRQCLITGSEDCTAKIWDLQKRTCIHTIQGFTAPVTHVISLPGRPYLVTCSRKATIHVWSSTDFRLKKTVFFSDDGDARGLVCLMGSRGIAIGQELTVSIMDIDDDDEAVASEGNKEDSECATGQSSNP